MIYKYRQHTIQRMFEIKTNLMFNLQAERFAVPKGPKHLFKFFITVT